MRTERRAVAETLFPRTNARFLRHDTFLLGKPMVRNSNTRVAGMLAIEELRQIDSLPMEFLEATPDKLYQLMPQPTLVHIEGRGQRPLFFSILLHGNEPAGLMAVQGLLKKFVGAELPRSISIFVGNIAAARVGVRRLEAQPDYNRVWPGSEYPPCVETALMQQVVDEMTRRDVVLSIDIHNNTGINPHYACINKLDNRFIHLAHLFGRLIVYFIRPKGVQSAAFAEHCPAVTLECGKPGQKYGIQHAQDFLETCLHLPELPNHPVPLGDIDLFHTVAQITIPAEIRFSFNDPECDLLLVGDLDRMNFTEVPTGTVLGKLKKNCPLLPIVALDELGKDRTADYFRIEQGELVMRKSVMPSMFTLDEKIIRQDCLCYLMERISV